MVKKKHSPAEILHSNAIDVIINKAIYPMASPFEDDTAGSGVAPLGII